jgi:hypothetical protein
VVKGQLDKTLPPGHRFDVGFDFLIDPGSTGDPVDFVSLVMNVAPAGYWVTLQISSAGDVSGFEATQNDSGALTTSPLAGSARVDVGGWHRLALVFEISAAPFVTLSVDGAPAALNANLTPAGAVATPLLQLGLDALAPVAAWAFHYDNVTFSSN